MHFGYVFNRYGVAQQHELDYDMRVWNFFNDLL